ncbi:MerR family transcriptional regulator [Lacrimispora sp. 38-1]|uniref:MerR family transcriptional regulator n=1 Tax=Lacrimispora sp. 38-1 TaxID=3125778 RepID=UPI003CF3AFEE
MLYTVGEMAKKLGVLPSTLRYYDKEGLLPFVERAEGGMRMFKDVDYEFLKIIGCLKSTGMQLKDIKVFIEMVQRGDDSIDERLELFRKQKDAVEKQLEALQTTMDIVSYKCWYYETAKKAGTTSAPDNMTEDELPEDMKLIREKIRK